MFYEPLGVSYGDNNWKDRIRHLSYRLCCWLLSWILSPRCYRIAYTGLLGTGVSSMLLETCVGYIDHTVYWTGHMPWNCYKIFFDGVWMKHEECHDRNNHRILLWTIDRMCSNVDAIIFCVDASDASQFENARKFLHRVFKHSSSEGKVFLILGTKSDLNGAVSRSHLMTSLGLQSVVDSDVEVRPADNQNDQIIQPSTKQSINQTIEQSHNQSNNQTVNVRHIGMFMSATSPPLNQSTTQLPDPRLSFKPAFKWLTGVLKKK